MMTSPLSSLGSSSGVAITSSRTDSFSGRLTVPGDKSISHRALMLAASAVGDTKITGLLEGEDVLATAQALRLLGAEIENVADGTWCVTGRGVGGLREPSEVLDLGNAGTGVRLLMGLVASHPFNSMFGGDASLSARPMERVMAPLRRMGVDFTTRSGGLLPLTVHGSDMLMPVKETLSVASAQVKSAILLAGLNTRGQTTVIEPAPSRNHTENLLSHFGAEVTVQDLTSGRAITLIGYPELLAKDIQVPADISSAAFPLVAGLLCPGGVTVENVSLNPLRTGLLDCLRDMGATVTLGNERFCGGEAIGDVTVDQSTLHGITVPAVRAPSMIDEYPILAMAAACATGDTVFEGVGELRVKESDRLGSLAAGLGACGVAVGETRDSLTIHGKGNAPNGGGCVSTHMDHRIAMSFLVLGMVTAAPVTVDDGTPIATSFPGFVSLMNGAGACFEDGGFPS